MFEENLTEQDFGKISTQILNQMVLVVKNKTFRICEIEMYLRTQFHPDLYVHSNPDQQNFGKFYFHKYANGTYKSGPKKCIKLNQFNTLFAFFIYKNGCRPNRKTILKCIKFNTL